MKNKGFTLIELLVVISIISVLSTVVMSSLQSARIKAQEAAIKSDLQSIKTQAELSHSKTGDYANVANEIVPILTHINANGGIASFYSHDNTRFAVSAKLNSNKLKYWTVSDQTGGIITWETQDLAGFPDWTTAKISCANLGGRISTVEELKSLRDSYGGYGQYPPNIIGDSYMVATPPTDYSVIIIAMYSSFIFPTSGGGKVRCVH